MSRGVVQAEIKEELGLRDEPLLRDHTPYFKALKYRCPRCDVVAVQGWTTLYKKQQKRTSGGVVAIEVEISDLAVSTCSACSGRCLWFEEKLLYPIGSALSEAAPNDMPPDLAKDFEEALAVATASPRAAAALLRMCVEGLCKHVTGQPTFDKAIGQLESGGLPDQIAKAMDVVRSNGNESLHAGRLYGSDDQRTVTLLIRLARMIVSWAITERRELDELFNAIPLERRQHIEERRAKNKGG